jgi:hypothetical protein
VEALKNCLEMKTVPMLLQILINVSVFFSEVGQTDRAATLLGVIRDHPSSAQETQDRARRLLDEKGLVVPEGEPASLDSLVSEILADLSPATSSDNVDSPAG